MADLPVLYWVCIVLALLFVIGGLADALGIYDLGLGPK